MVKIKKVFGLILLMTFLWQNAAFCYTERSFTLRVPSHFSESPEKFAKNQPKIVIEKFAKILLAGNITIVNVRIGEQLYEISGAGVKKLNADLTSEVVEDLQECIRIANLVNEADGRLGEAAKEENWNWWTPLQNSLAEEEWIPAEGLEGILLNTKTGRIKYANKDELPMKAGFVLWVVRHGETEGNRIKGFFQGAGDGKINQLTKESEEKAIPTAKRLFDHLKVRLKLKEKLVVVISPLTRARKTAEPFIELAEKDGVLERAPEELDELSREISFGIYDSKTMEELKRDLDDEQFRQYEIYEKGYRGGPDAAIIPKNGESFLQMLIRTKKLLEELNRLYKGRVVVIYGHGTAFSAVRVLLGDNAMVDETGQINWRRYLLPNSTPTLLSTIESPDSPGNILGYNLAVGSQL
jgi:broad specificity phosphatase PhoE